MTEKQYTYILSQYPFYEGEEILMISSSYDEITTHYIRVLRKLEKGYGLIIRKYEYGKQYDNIKERPENIRWIEKEYGGKVKNILKEYTLLGE